MRGRPQEPDQWISASGGAIPGNGREGEPGRGSLLNWPLLVPPKTRDHEGAIDGNDGQGARSVGEEKKLGSGLLHPRGWLWEAPRGTKVDGRGDRRGDGRGGVHGRRWLEANNSLGLA